MQFINDFFYKKLLMYVDNLFHHHNKIVSGLKNTFSLILLDNLIKCYLTVIRLLIEWEIIEKNV